MNLGVKRWLGKPASECARYEVTMRLLLQYVRFETGSLQLLCSANITCTRPFCRSFLDFGFFASSTPIDGHLARYDLRVSVSSSILGTSDC